jgi:2-keto-4-pentenoate hydratase/2-oxohepta-3-ene-1,7-dioic acid hydratase in catechol pathway
MKFGRFVDDLGQTIYGFSLGGGRAGVLAGDPYSGLEPTGRETAAHRWLAPIDPVNIYCIGLNYREHARETGAPIPEHPVVFMKPTTAITGHEAPIRLPAACRHGPEVDYEAELAVVIGRTARDVPVERALEHVLGYTCANDVSARRWQKHGGGGQWVRGKSFDTFCPLGPQMVTADEVADPQDLAVRCELNGRVMQQGHTGDMIFSVAELISRLSQDTTLEPGTLLLTGTPAGVGFTRQPPVFLTAGDRVRVTIGQVGTLENPVEAA